MDEMNFLAVAQTTSNNLEPRAHEPKNGKGIDKMYVGETP